MPLVIGESALPVLTTLSLSPSSTSHAHPLPNYAVIRITFSRIIDIIAGRASPFFHCQPPDSLLLFYNYADYRHVACNAFISGSKGNSEYPSVLPDRFSRNNMRSMSFSACFISEMERSPTNFFNLSYPQFSAISACTTY